MKLCASLVLSILFGPAEVQKSVVSIEATRAADKIGKGTGFFISETGRILTCYHVIMGAKEIKVVDRESEYTRVIVEEVDPDRDLAILAVNGREKFFPLELVEEPPAAETTPVTVVGHPGGLENSTLQGKTVRAGFVSSLEIRDRKTGGRIFAKKIDIIALDILVYRGMSGAPILTKKGVIGILSGSWQEGGALTWAIPSKYAKNLPLRLSKPPSEIGSWPKLALMAKDTWRSLAATSKREKYTELTAEERILLKPFFEKGKYQPGMSRGEVRQVSDKDSKPVSLSALQTTGVLESSDAGIKALVKFVIKKLNDRPTKWAYANSKKTKWAHDEAKLKRIQELLRTRGPELVARGLLAP